MRLTISSLIILYSFSLQFLEDFSTPKYDFNRQFFSSLCNFLLSTILYVNYLFFYSTYLMRLSIPSFILLYSFSLQFLANFSTLKYDFNR